MGLSRDGHAVIFHGDDLEWSSNGQGTLDDTDLRQLRGIDTGLGGGVMTLEEALDEVLRHPHMRLQLELKGQTNYPRGAYCLQPWSSAAASSTGTSPTGTSPTGSIPARFPPGWERACRSVSNQDFMIVKATVRALRAAHFPASKLIVASHDPVRLKAWTSLAPEYPVICIVFLPQSFPLSFPLASEYYGAQHVSASTSDVTEENILIGP